MRPRIWQWGDSVASLRRCVHAGGIVALPTESSYALGALPGSRAGIEAIDKLKRRGGGQPMPVVAASLEQIGDLGVATGAAERDAVAACWPAALSIVLPLVVPLPACGSENGLAVRIPGHARLRALLEELGTPLTATSANRAGEPPIVDVASLIEWLADTDSWIVTDGRLPGGPPSTLVRWNGKRFDVLRNGRVPFPCHLEGTRSSIC